MPKQKPLVRRHLERISGDVLSQYRDVISEYVKGQYGVYALYRGRRLQYVGLASNLRSRLDQHLKDRHAGTWDHFSVYLTVTDEHLRELESLVLRIAEPRGNKLAGQFFDSEDLRPKLLRQFDDFIRLERDRIMGIAALKKEVKKIESQVKANGDGRVPTLAKYVRKTFTIRMTYKGKLYKARVNSDGTIYHRKKTYQSPSSAAAAVTGGHIDGWHAWKYLRIPGGWTTLDALRR